MYKLKICSKAVTLNLVFCHAWSMPNYKIQCQGRSCRDAYSDKIINFYNWLDGI